MATTIIEASRETSERYIVRSTHQSENAALRKARKIDGAVVIHVRESHIYSEHWYVAVENSPLDQVRGPGMFVQGEWTHGDFSACLSDD